MWKCSSDATQSTAVVYNSLQFRSDFVECNAKPNRTTNQLTIFCLHVCDRMRTKIRFWLLPYLLFSKMETFNILLFVCVSDAASHSHMHAASEWCRTINAQSPCHGTGARSLRTTTTESMTRSDVLHDSNDEIQVLADEIIGSTQIILWTVSIEGCTLRAYKSISKISFKF